MIQLLLILVATQLAAGAPEPSTEPDETLSGYRWQAIIDGVYLHGPQDPLAGPVDGNSVVIENGDGVVVVDTHINPAAARAAIARIQDDIGKPVSTVINTHWHDDHVNGNYVYRDAFPDVQIIAHRETLAALRENWADLEDSRRHGYANADPDDLLAQAEILDDPYRAWSMRVYAGYVSALKPELDALELVYPQTVFDDRFVIRGDTRRIELHWLGPGNTDGDIVAWLPDDKVLITGDLLVAPIPFAFDSPMVDWIEALDRLKLIDAAIIIPGHGPVQRNKRYLEQVATLLRTTLDSVEAAYRKGSRYDNLPNAVSLEELRGDFTGGDPELDHAWQSFFVTPGLNSAWRSLGYEVPADP